MKILIVDDDQKIVKSTKIYLKTKGFNDVDVLTDARKVIEQLTKDKYDVLILDLNMPFISGFTIMDEIASIKLQIQIFVISAMDLKSSISKGLNLGTSVYFKKPIDNHKLINAIKDLHED